MMHTAKSLRISCLLALISCIWLASSTHLAFSEEVAEAETVSETEVPAETAENAPEPPAESTDLADTAEPADEQPEKSALDKFVEDKERYEAEKEAQREAAKEALFEPEPYDGEPRSVYIVPITEVINKANYFILKRSIKEAIANDVDTILLNIDTPGGSLGYCLEMMQALDNFEGQTIAYVNPDAISAGAFISMVTDEIYFHPSGAMGAAAVISGDGGDIPETLLNKIMSYLDAKMRAYTEEHPYRADVMRAMSEPDAEVEIEGEMLKAKEDRLLTVTATEATKLYGDPLKPLLARGIAKDTDELLDNLYGAGKYTVKDFEISWAENAAKFFETVMPVVLSIGVLMLLIEIKTPSFGLIGGLGIALIAAAILSNYIAGLAGKELVVLLVLGFLLMIVDLFLFPGTFFMGILGMLLILFAITWSMVDAWPKDGGGIPRFEIQSLMNSATTVVLAFMVAIGVFLAVMKYLPGNPIFRRFVHSGTSASPDVVASGGGSTVSGATSLPDIGSKGIVTKPLHPGGEVEVDGQRYSATVASGMLDKGERIVVSGYRNFAILVDKDDLGA